MNKKHCNTFFTFIDIKITGLTRNEKLGVSYSFKKSNECKRENNS